MFQSEKNERTELEIILEQTRIIANLTHKDHGPHNVHLVLTSIINNSKFIIMSVSIATNQKSLGQLGLVDQVTLAAVTGTFSGTTAVSDTPAAFLASVDANGNAVVTGVSAGSGNVTVGALASFTDSTGAAQSQQLTVVVPVIVTAITTADAVNLVVNFGTPVAQ